MRRPTETVQVNLRIKERLRRRLESAAKKRQVSLNYEMTSRLEQSLDAENLVTIDSVASDMETNWHRWGEALHALNKQGDLLRAAEALLAANLAVPPEQKIIEKAVGRVREAIAMIDLEAKMAVRRAHTAGQLIELERSK